MYPRSHGFFGGAPIDDSSGATGSESSVTALGIRDMAFTRRDGREAPTPSLTGNFDLRQQKGNCPNSRWDSLRPFTHVPKFDAAPPAIGSGADRGSWLVHDGRRHGRGRGPAGRTILSRFDCESCTDCRRRRGRHTGLLQEEAQEEEEEEVRHEVTGLQCFDSGRGDH